MTAKEALDLPLAQYLRSLGLLVEYDFNWNRGYAPWFDVRNEARTWHVQIDAHAPLDELIAEMPSMAETPDPTWQIRGSREDRRGLHAAMRGVSDPNHSENRWEIDAATEPTNPDDLNDTEIDRLRRMDGPPPVDVVRLSRSVHGLVIRALRELVSRRRAVDWEPIDHAPRDGRLILVDNPRTVAKWEPFGAEGEPDHGWWAEQPEGNRVAPTHWMPLPERSR